MVVTSWIISSGLVRRWEEWVLCGAAEYGGVGVRRLSERPGEAHLLRGEVDTRELRHAGGSPLFVDSIITQHNVTGAGLLFVMVMCESE